MGEEATSDFFRVLTTLEPSNVGGYVGGLPTSNA